MYQRGKQAISYHPTYLTGIMVARQSYHTAHVLHFRQWTNSWWRHQMEAFSALLAFCVGNSPVTGEFPSQRPVTRSFDVIFFIWAWINGWVNNREAGDLRRNRGHYDVPLMIQPVLTAMSAMCWWSHPRENNPTTAFPDSCRMRYLMVTMLGLRSLSTSSMRPL